MSEDECNYIFFDEHFVAAGKQFGIKSGLDS